MANNKTNIDSAEEIFNDENLNQLEKDFIKRYKGNEKHPVKVLLKFYKGYYGKLILSSIFFLIKTSPVWVMPIIAANLIDLITQKPDNMFFSIAINLIIICLLLALNIPFHYLFIKYQSIATRNVEAGLRGALVRKLQHLSIPFYKEMQSGRIQSKVMRDVEAIYSLSSEIFVNILSVVVNLFIALGVVLTKNITVFFFFLLCGPVAAIISTSFNKKIRKNNRAFRKEIEQTSANVMDMVEMVSLTRAHALENKEISKMNRQLNSVAVKGFRLDMVQSIFNSVNWVVFQVFQLMCLGFSIYMAYNGKITVGDVTLYQSYFTTLVSGVSTIISLMPTITRGTESVISVGEILSAEDEEINDNKIKIDELKGNFVFKDVSFSYEDDRLILNNFNLEVKPGETIALVGESGTGKSTVLNMVIGFNFANSGAVLVDGHNIKDLDLHSYRKHIAVVPQTSVMFSGTIRENITYGLTSVSEEKLTEILEAARLTEVVQSLPNGLDTVIGEHGGKLSGGQRQRISIARALIREPSVIILDEATSALDSVSEKKIQEALKHLTDGRTTFIVAHRLSTIKDADKIAVMKSGKCVEYGTFDELIAKKGEFYKYRQMQI